MKKRVSLRLIQLSIAALCAGFSANSFASGFQLFEVNGEGLGDFYAGAAANANDASAAFFNPAALVTMKNPQVQLSAVGIFSNSEFQGTSRLSLLGTNTFSGTAQGGGYKTVPSLEAAGPINNEMAWGFSVAVPFGLNTNYDSNSFLRYAATKTAVQVIDVSPSLGFKVTDKLSLGLGLDADRLDVDFNSMVGIGASPAFDRLSENNASGWGYGWHAGALYQFTPDSRLGFEYRSRVSYTINGTSKLTGVGSLASGVLTSDDLTGNTTLPATSLLSFVHQFNPAWTGEATVMYTQWNVFQNITLQNVQSNVPGVTGTVTVPEHFRNTWRTAIGATYHPFKQWLFRAGLGYDQTPTEDQDRNVRLPDGNRFATSLGVHYQATKNLGMDVGWTHLFFQDGDVNVTQNTQTPAGTEVVTTNGTAKTSADLVGVQLTWDFV